MAKTPVANEAPTRAELKALIQQHGAELSRQLQAHHRNIFPPEAEKTIRHFSPTESASLIGIHEGYLRQVAAEGKGVSPSIKNGRRSYSVDAIQEIRKQLDQGARGGRRYLPHRRSSEHLQVITVMNFKGGSGKTTNPRISRNISPFMAIGCWLSTSIRKQASGFVRSPARAPCWPQRDFLRRYPLR